MSYHLLAHLSFTEEEREQANRVLLEAFKQTTDEPVTFVRIVQMGFKTFVGSALLFGVLGIFTGSFSIISCGGIFCWTIMFTPIGLGYMDQQRSNHLRRLAAKALLQAGDPDCLVALYEHIRLPSIFRKDALATIQAILPRVTADCYGRLPPGTAVTLARLAGSSDEKLALAALEALEQAGDGVAANAVQKLATRATSERVRNRAAALLPILIERAAHKMTASTLLRPSTQNQSEHLVRPVTGRPAELTNLLRAAHSATDTNPAETNQESEN